MAPRISVIVRSYNRLGYTCELIECLLAQTHDSFEIVVVEQSTDRPSAAAARLAELERNPRVHVLHSKPLGGAGARNAAVRRARGDLLVFIDDDDLPIGADFLELMERPFREDPNCMGITCRHYWGDATEISPRYRRMAARRCMRFSRWLRLPYTYPRYDRPVRGVDYVHGTGAALRWSVIEQFGGWDVDTPIEDETSFGIRAGRGLARGEYFAFDPRAGLRRRMNLDGGLGKRRLSAGGHYRKFMTFTHHILGRYYPVRVRLLYLAYVLAGVMWTIDWIWNDSTAHPTLPRKLLGTAGFLASAPYHAALALGEPLGRAPASGELLIGHRAGRAAGGDPVDAVSGMQG